MKKVLASHNQVAHFWANQVQTEGSANNVFFEGKKIYSYGRHYVIAELFPEESICLVNSNGYSTSTAKHTSIVRRAIPRHYTTIAVPGASLNQDTMQWFENRISDAINNAANARKNVDIYLSGAQTHLNNAVIISEKFGYALTPQLIEWQKVGVASSGNIEKAREAEKKRRAAAIVKHKEDIEEWLNCAAYSIPSAVDKIYLRVKCSDSTIVETSHHAEVPVSDARKLFRAIKSGLPVHGTQIGNYYVRSFDGNSLVIGCHKLLVSEINRFAALQGWGFIESGKLANA